MANENEDTPDFGGSSWSQDETREEWIARKKAYQDYLAKQGITAEGPTPPPGFTQKQWDAMNIAERRKAVEVPGMGDPTAANHASVARFSDAEIGNQQQLEARGKSGTMGAARDINQYYYEHGYYPRVNSATGQLMQGGPTPKYAGPAELMSMTDPRRGGNVEGMDYSGLHAQPPRMAAPQGRNSQLPAYGSWGYNQPAPATPMPMSPQGYANTNINMLPVTTQQTAPGTPGTPRASVQSAAANAPAAQTLAEDPARVAQQRVLARMALSPRGGAAQQAGVALPEGYVSPEDRLGRL